MSEADVSMRLHVQLLVLWLIGSLLLHPSVLTNLPVPQEYCQGPG